MPTKIHVDLDEVSYEKDLWEDLSIGDYVVTNGDGVIVSAAPFLAQIRIKNEYIIGLIRNDKIPGVGPTGEWLVSRLHKIPKLIVNFDYHATCAICGLPKAGEFIENSYTCYACVKKIPKCDICGNYGVGKAILDISIPSQFKKIKTILGVDQNISEWGRGIFKANDIYILYNNKVYCTDCFMNQINYCTNCGTISSEPRKRINVYLPTKREAIVLNYCEVCSKDKYVKCCNTVCNSWILKDKKLEDALGKVKCLECLKEENLGKLERIKVVNISKTVSLMGK